MEFAIEIITEADDIMGDTLAALKALNDNPEMLRTLQINTQFVYQTFDRQNQFKGILRW